MPAFYAVNATRQLKDWSKKLSGKYPNWVPRRSKIVEFKWSQRNFEVWQLSGGSKLVEDYDWLKNTDLIVQGFVDLVLPCQVVLLVRDAAGADDAVEHLGRKNLNKPSKILRVFFFIFHFYQLSFSWSFSHSFLHFLASKWAWLLITQLTASYPTHAMRAGPIKLAKVANIPHILLLWITWNNNLFKLRQERD